MAEAPVATLVFDGTCPDCGHRRVRLPPALPPAGDDFDWHTRDFDSYRRFMLEELFARFPERTRWTEADLEVVLVEALAAVLDQLSDMADRVAAEAFLETARRPASVRRLLGFIGYDALRLARDTRSGPFAAPPAPDDTRTDAERFDQFWLDNPSAMDAARHAGPRAVHRQRRMVTSDDYAVRLEEHPLVRRAHAWSAWSGAWLTLRVAVIAWAGRTLDETGPRYGSDGEGSGGGEPAGAVYPPDLRAEVRRFHEERGLPWPPPAEEAAFWDARPSIRVILRPYVDAYRMAGQEVQLEDAVPVPVTLSLSVLVGERYFRSEVRRAVVERLGTGPGGFFEPGRLRFGENLYAADVYEAVTALDGVENVCLNRFKRLGGQYADQVASGVIELEGLEIAVCDNDPRRPQRGYFRLELHGGRRG